MVGFDTEVDIYRMKWKKEAILSIGSLTMLTRFTVMLCFCQLGFQTCLTYTDPLGRLAIVLINSFSFPACLSAFGMSTCSMLVILKSLTLERRMRRRSIAVELHFGTLLYTSQEFSNVLFVAEATTSERSWAALS